MINSIHHLLTLQFQFVGRSGEFQKVTEHSNRDLDNIVTPVNVGNLARLLNESNYNKQKTEYLIDGFTNGFDLCYRGPVNRSDHSRNIPLRVGDKFELWEKIMKEVGLGRYAGLFEEIPFDKFVQSPIGLVPKDGGKKTRLMFHLSYDFPVSGFRSINSFIPKELCSVKYNDLDTAIQNSFHWGGQSQKVVYGKTDVQSAFCLALLKKSCWRWLVMMAPNPITGKMLFFIDKCLPFGASINCAIFQEISNALKHITEFKTVIYCAITNYLDDFLFVAVMIRKCNHMLKEFLEICLVVGIPILSEKTVWATDLITFLGFLLNGSRFELSVPEEKRIKATNALQKMVSKRKTTVKEIQQLTSLLNFLCRGIFTGRAFTRRMYAKYAKMTDKKTGILKQHHHICIDKEFRDDCSVWLQFLRSDVISVVNRPYVDFASSTIAEELQFFSDALLNSSLGFGARFDREWTYAQWPCDFITVCKSSIEYVELYALVLTAYVWSHKLSNRRVIVYCDNESVMYMVNDSMSSCANCMILL